MAEIGRWNGHKFEVSSSLIRSFTGLQIKGSSETEDKESGNQKYVSRKNGKPVEVSFTIHLNARFGCDVRSEAMSLVSEAIAGKKDYFYVGNKKLVTCQLMLVDATVREIGLVNSGTWTQADVQVTMKQCSKNDGNSGGGSGSGSGSSGSGKTSVKKTSTTTTKSTGIVQKIADGIRNVVSSVVNGAKKAVTTVKNVLTGKTSVASAATSAIKAGVSAVKKVATVAKAVSTAKKSTTTSKAKAKIKSIVNKVKTKKK